MRTNQANRVLIGESVCRRARVCGLIRRGARGHSAAVKILNWFQIPATDIDRAVKFYEAVFQVTFHRMDDGRSKHAFFGVDTLGTDRTGGEILQSPDEQPSTSGVTLYLNTPDGVDATLSRVEAAGGKITRPKMSIGENGVIALILDTEGNEVGLHGMQ